MRSDGVSLAPIEIADLDPKSSSFNHTVHQSLEPNPIDLRLDGFKPRSAVLFKVNRKESFIASGVQFHVSTGHQLKKE